MLLLNIAEKHNKKIMDNHSDSNEKTVGRGRQYNDTYMILGMCIGICLGVAVGFITHGIFGIGIGVALGAAAGLLIGMSIKKQNKI